MSGSGAAWLISDLGPDSVTVLEFEFEGVEVRTDSACDAVDLPVGVPIDSSGPSDGAVVN
jgi:hypothetical protein